MRWKCRTASKTCTRHVKHPVKSRWNLKKQWNKFNCRSCYLCHFPAAYFWARLYCTCHRRIWAKFRHINTSARASARSHLSAYFEYFMPIPYTQHKSSVRSRCLVVCCFGHFTVDVCFFLCFAVLPLATHSTIVFCSGFDHPTGCVRPVSSSVEYIYSRPVQFLIAIQQCFCWAHRVLFVNISLSFVVFDAWTKFICVIYNAMSNCVSARVVYESKEEIWHGVSQGFAIQNVRPRYFYHGSDCVQVSVCVFFFSSFFSFSFLFPVSFLSLLSLSLWRIFLCRYMYRGVYLWYSVSFCRKEKINEEEEEEEKGRRTYRCGGIPFDSTR